MRNSHSFKQFKSTRVPLPSSLPLFQQEKHSAETSQRSLGLLGEDTRSSLELLSRKEDRPSHVLPVTPAVTPTFFEVLDLAPQRNVLITSLAPLRPSGKPEHAVRDVIDQAKLDRLQFALHRS